LIRSAAISGRAARLKYRSLADQQFSCIGQARYERRWPASQSAQREAARSDDLFASLDRWLWKQQARETEAWLAKSHDIYDLERRIRHLERNGSGWLF